MTSICGVWVAISDLCCDSIIAPDERINLRVRIKLCADSFQLFFCARAFAVSTSLCLNKKGFGSRVSISRARPNRFVGPGYRCGYACVGGYLHNYQGKHTATVMMDTLFYRVVVCVRHRICIVCIVWLIYCVHRGNDRSLGNENICF